MSPHAGAQRSNPLGTVTALRRYPVKSMLGEAIEHGVVTARGLEGDRAHALVDIETGKIATAKRPHLWKALLGFTATLTGSGPHVTLPDGVTIALDDPNAETILSGAIGRRVKVTAVREPGAAVERARPDEVIEKGIDSAEVEADHLELAAAAPLGGFFDYAPLGLLTAASLARIAEAVPDEPIALERYRPNIVIDAPGAGAFTENGWRGQIMRIGPDLVLEILIPTPRCAVPMLPYGKVPAAFGAVAAVNRLNRIALPELGEGTFPCLGAFARVVEPGELRVGQAVSFVD